MAAAAPNGWLERVHPVRQLSWGRVTSWQDGALTVDPAGLRAALGRPAGVDGIELDLARPGEAVRVVHVLDAVEPSTAAFAGSFSPLDPAGWHAGGGRPAIARLAGAAVLTAGCFRPEGDYLRDQSECLVEMSGPAAAYSPFGATQNVVVTLRFDPGADNARRCEAARLTGLRAARHLAGAAAGTRPAREESFFASPAEGLPGVGYVCSLITEGRLHDCHIYGEGAPPQMLPTLLPAGELADGAIVCSDYHYAGQRTPTYLYQVNPVLRALAGRHGKDLRFAGVVLTQRHDSHVGKERGAAMSAGLLRLLGARGAVVSAAAGGNAHIDAMFVVRACARRGLAAVPVLLEMAGPAGDDPGVVDFVPEADAIVSVGNREQLVDLPAPERTLGDDGRWLPPGGEGSPSGRCRVPLRHFLASTSQVGSGRLTARSA